MESISEKQTEVQKEIIKFPFQIVIYPDSWIGEAQGRWIVGITQTKGGEALTEYTGCSSLRNTLDIIELFLQEQKEY